MNLAVRPTLHICEPADRLTPRAALSRLNYAACSQRRMARRCDSLGRSRLGWLSGGHSRPAIQPGGAQTAISVSAIMAKISIVIPVLNPRPRISETLESIRQQTYPRDEIETIIVDDGSSDQCVGIARTFLKRHGMQGTSSLPAETTVAAHRSTGAGRQPPAIGSSSSTATTSSRRANSTCKFANSRSCPMSFARAGSALDPTGTAGNPLGLRRAPSLPSRAPRACVPASRPFGPGAHSQEIPGGRRRVFRRGGLPRRRASDAQALGNGRQVCGGAISLPSVLRPSRPRREGPRPEPGFGASAPAKHGHRRGDVAATEVRNSHAPGAQAKSPASATGA